MAEIILKNSGELSAEYNGQTIYFDTNEVSTTIVSGIVATKAVDKAYWVNGPLLYTVTVANTSGVDLEDITLVDMLSEIVTVDEEYGVKIGGTTTPYTFFSHVLSVPLPEIEDGASVTVTFQVLQV